MPTQSEASTPEGEKGSQPSAEPPDQVRALGPHLFASPEQFVRRALTLMPAPPDALIDVAGPDGLAAMVSLCRMGFERVECARQATCSGADEPGDLLLIAGALPAANLAALIRRTTRLLHDDAAIAIQLADAEAEAAVLPALAAAGFAPTFTLIDRTVGRMLLHKVRRVARAAARSVAA